MDILYAPVNQQKGQDGTYYADDGTLKPLGRVPGELYAYFQGNSGQDNSPDSDATGGYGKRGDAVQ